MNKKGQFFIIAALIIVTVIIGLTTIYVASNTPSEDKQVIDLSEEIDYESSQVIDNGVFQGTQDQIFNQIKILTTSYAKLNPESDFAVYYGNANGVEAITYVVDEQGRVGFSFGGADSDITLNRRIILEGQYEGDLTAGNVEISFGEFTQTYNLKEGQNFFILVKKESQNERTVASS